MHIDLLEVPCAGEGKTFPPDAIVLGFCEWNTTFLSFCSVFIFTQTKRRNRLRG
jgi:hypothetical protein